MHEPGNTTRPLSAILAAILILAGGCSARRGQAMANEKNTEPAGRYKSAMFGAGCFWGVEETFRTLDGAVETAVGYSGGTVKNPTYEQVCGGKTGHAEVIHIKYDPNKVSYEKLLDVFWDNHNPTTLNRQGPDVGYQYRSVIFYYTPEQQAAAEASKERLAESERFPSPIVTAIEPAKEFYRAEEYHQRYLEKRGIKACHY
jgi:peptide-methionine (S)-S-oxide reductase